MYIAKAIKLTVYSSQLIPILFLLSILVGCSSPYSASRLVKPGMTPEQFEADCQLCEDEYQSKIYLRETARYRTFFDACMIIKGYRWERTE